MFYILRIYRYFVGDNTQTMKIRPSICIVIAAIAVLLTNDLVAQNSIVVGAERINRYRPFLYGKNVAIVGNQTSQIGSVHLVDSLLSLDVNIVKIFAPEHGFRGTADAGEYVSNGRDTKTGIPIVSLYGANKELPVEHLDGVDIVIFDIQDVGARFYTYISTLHYVMKSCGAAGVPLIVLDRPNPNGFYVDGPVNTLEKPSFVAMHPVPVVHGMTIAEYAQMILGEGWISPSFELDLIVIPCENYTHDSIYRLPVKPSPNLPTHNSVMLYPSLCFFEGTNVSIGRGTESPFEMVGAPWFPKDAPYSFIPESMSGAKYPKYEGEKCYGYNLEMFGRLAPQQRRLNLFWLMQSYQMAPDKSVFFNPDFFDLLAGGSALREMVEAGKDETEIIESWAEGLNNYLQIRKKYLLYKDFTPFSNDPQFRRGMAPSKR